MKRTLQIAAIGMTLAFGLGCLPSVAQTTETTGNVTTSTGTFNNVVINSTYTFSGLGIGSSFNAILDQSTIANISSLIPPVQFELVLTSLTYTDTSDTFDGTGAPVTMSFQMTPTLNMVSPSPSTTVTLTGPTIANGTDVTASTAHPVTFNLTTPLVFPIEPEQNGGNLDSGTGTFSESVSNFEPQNSVTLSGVLNGQPFNFNPSDFTNLGGTVEVIYAAVPEPSSGWLAILAGFGIATLFAARGRTAKAD